MKHLPYNTGKVLIGCRYTPPPPRYHLSADDERLQRALLGLGRPRASAEYRAGLWLITLLLVLGLIAVVQ